MLEVQDLGKTLITLGLLIAGFGLVLNVFGEIPGLGNLPGDIYIEGDGYSLYFPLTTCILLSILLSFLMYVYGSVFQ